MDRLPAFILLSACWNAASASDIPPPRPVDVAAIIRQLGSEDFSELEEASRRLATLSVDHPPPELLAALKSTNPEVRDRARRALKGLEEHIVRERERIELGHLPRGERFARRGQIDLYVASTAISPWKTDDDRLWVPAFEVGKTAVKKIGLKANYRPGGPMWEGVKDFPTYRKVVHQKLIRTEGVFSRRGTDYFCFHGAVIAAGVAEPQSLKAFLVSRGHVSVKKHIDNSFVLATGNVVAEQGMSDTVIICDGDVLVNESMRCCFIIARGCIGVEGWGYENTLIAGQTVRFKKAVPLPNQQTIPKEMQNRVTENMARPLGYITFFELSTVGVDVKAADGAVQVAAIADGKPFADAGVKVGDIITEVNGKKPESAESLRRLLRDALAIGDATVQLQRGDKGVTVKVSLPE